MDVVMQIIGWIPIAILVIGRIYLVYTIAKGFIAASEEEDRKEKHRQFKMAFGTEEEKQTALLEELLENNRRIAGIAAFTALEHFDDMSDKK